MVGSVGVSSRDKARQTSGSIEKLIADLAGDDLRTRRAARAALVEIGEPAVAPLIAALNQHVLPLRWEAAHTLVKIPSAAAIPVWIKELMDDNCDIRWLAAEGLIAQGEAALVPLLQALEQHSDSVCFRDGAHRVLSKLARASLGQILLPVVVALEDFEPALEAPVAAFQALQALKASSRP